VKIFPVGGGYTKKQRELQAERKKNDKAFALKVCLRKINVKKYIVEDSTIYFRANISPYKYYLTFINYFMSVFSNIV
jgi:hypothetical protein